MVIETGTCHGLSTVVMAQAMKDFGYRGRIYTIEIEPKNMIKAKQNIDAAGLGQYIECILGDSKKVLRMLLSKLKRLDFAYLDSDHSEAAVLEEFELVADLVEKSDGYIYFDNVNEGGGRDALRKIKGLYPGGNLILFPNCSWGPPGQAVWSFKGWNEIG